jgi:hypothetical protein
MRDNTMRTIRIFSILVILITTFNLSYSQTDKNGGSLYSIFGLGDLSYSSSTRTDGMGVMGIALYGNYTNSLNPATWTGIENTRFATKFNLENIRSSDGINTSKRTYGNFEGFDLSIPLNKGNGWIFDLGLNTFSTVGYTTKFTGTVLGEDYTQSYNGKGGLTRINLGFSYIILKYFSFGLQFNYAFGNIVKNTRIDFVNPNLFNTNNNLSDNISGYYFNTGLIFHGFGMLFNTKKADKMTLGVFFSIPGKFKSNITGSFNRSTNPDSVSLTSGTVEIPWSGGIGISNEFNKKLVVAADVFMQNWNSYKYYGVHPPEIKNSLRIGAGLEYTPSKKIEDPFLKKVSYRLGANYTMDYLKINGEAINTIGVTAGLSIPVSRLNSVDLLFSYKIRGKDTNGLIKDNIFRLGATVNIGEIWFLKPREDN